MPPKNGKRIDINTAQSYVVDNKPWILIISNEKNHSSLISIAKRKAGNNKPILIIPRSQCNRPAVKDDLFTYAGIRGCPPNKSIYLFKNYNYERLFSMPHTAKPAAKKGIITQKKIEPPKTQPVLQRQISNDVLAMVNGYINGVEKVSNALLAAEKNPSSTNIQRVESEMKKLDDLIRKKDSRHFESHDLDLLTRELDKINLKRAEFSRRLKKIKDSKLLSKAKTKTILGIVVTGLLFFIVIILL